MDALVSVEIHDKKRCHRVSYHPAKKRTFWSGALPEGFTVSMSEKLHTKEDIESGIWAKAVYMPGYDHIPLLVIDNKAYYPPYIKLKFAGGVEKVINCTTLENAIEQGERISNSGMKNKIQMIVEGEEYQVKIPFKF